MQYPIIVNNVEVGSFEKVIYSEGFGHALITRKLDGTATDVYLWIEALGEVFRFRATDEVIALIKDASITQMSLADLCTLYDEWGRHDDLHR